jgi:hypothetical protein
LAFLLKPHCEAAAESGKLRLSTGKTIINGFPGRKLVEHIWILIGVARTCEHMVELRQKMAELDGKTLVQLMLPLPLLKN